MNDDFFVPVSWMIHLAFHFGIFSHVHGFLEEIGQGIQHVASRVDNLVEFIQRCNDMREVTGEVGCPFCLH